MLLNELSSEDKDRTFARQYRVRRQNRAITACTLGLCSGLGSDIPSG